jgi:plastocyanin
MRGKKSFVGVLIAVLVIALLGLTACELEAEEAPGTPVAPAETPGVTPDDEPGLVPDQTPEEPGVAPDQTPGMTPETTPDDDEVNEVEVTLRDGEIDMDEELEAGPTVFEITNDGSLEHSFRIEGQGVMEELEQPLQPGETQMLEVNLQPGEYEVICPVNDHAAQGMRLQVTVIDQNQQQNQQ